MLNIGLTYAWNWADSQNKALTQFTNFWRLPRRSSLQPIWRPDESLTHSRCRSRFSRSCVGSRILYEIRRMQVVLELGERALIELEKVVADGLCINELRILSQQHHAVEGLRMRILTYVLFIGGAVMWSVAAVYAITRS